MDALWYKEFNESGEDSEGTIYATPEFACEGIPDADDYDMNAYILVFPDDGKEETEDAMQEAISVLRESIDNCGDSNVDMLHDGNKIYFITSNERYGDFEWSEVGSGWSSFSLPFSLEKLAKIPVPFAIHVLALNGGMTVDIVARDSFGEPFKLCSISNTDSDAYEGLMNDSYGNFVRFDVQGGDFDPILINVYTEDEDAVTAYEFDKVDFESDGDSHYKDCGDVYYMRGCKGTDEAENPQGLEFNGDGLLDKDGNEIHTWSANQIYYTRWGNPVILNPDKEDIDEQKKCLKASAKSKYLKS